MNFLFKMSEQDRMERIKIIYTEDTTAADIPSVLPVHSRTLSFPKLGDRASTSTHVLDGHHFGRQRLEAGVTNPAFIDDEKKDDNGLNDVEIGKTAGTKRTKGKSGFRSSTSEITLGMKLTESDTVALRDPWEKVRLQNMNKELGFRDSMLRDFDGANSTMRDSTLTSIQNEKRKTWDVFRLISKKEDTSEDIPYFNTTEKVAKILVGLLLTFSLATLTLVSKSSLLLITSNLYENVSLDCHKTKDGLVCHRLPLSHVQRISFVPSAAVQVEWLWALIVVVCAPYVITSFRCMWRICFKKTRKISCRTFFMICLIETLHTGGLTMFVFLVLPSLDAMRGEALMLGGAVIPALLKLFDNESKRGKRAYGVLTDVISFMVQLSVLVIWPVIEWQRGRHQLAYFIPISLVLISLGWWENYINQFSHLGTTVTTRLKELKRNVRRMRARIYLLIAPWKVVLTIGLVSAAVSEGDLGCLQLMYFREASNYSCSRMVSESLNATKVFYPDFRQPYWIALVQISSCFLCFVIARNACKMMLQVTSFAIPLSLSPPLIMAFFIGNCEAWRKDQLFNWLGMQSLFWTCDLPEVTSGYLKPAVLQFYFPIVIAWWFSYLSVTAHIWFPRVERLVQTERLFVQNFYCDIFLQHSLTLNRRRDDKDRDKNSKKTKQFEFPTFSSMLPPMDLLLSYSSMRTDTTPMIFVCATMWHETEKETIKILTSIFRLDTDQSARRHAQRYFDIVDPDYYEFEGHIFFDDAFEAHDLEDENYKVNGYVKQLINSMNTAANVVHKFPVRLSSPILYDTPYGGRLEWKLPGGNRLSAHLKDKQKIRHRKRWSQVMYMYYFLGYRLITQPMNARRKQTIADHTFLLALDGDVDFKPAALQLLVDRMKKSDKVAAACGRIHPKGSGPMLWYQKFEYAISHWLQKSTEHMIGCVLCSPGCFSLFRGSALMDDNVMRKYAIPPTEARHYVQYDQGEDRWLCTLLLQQGYRVEYCAASDAMTFAPEGFNEFFNQRRRWSPSTMANIMDLLQDWRHVIRVNENISGLYIFYQLMLFVSAMLTPGTIFLLIVGAVSTAFPSISLIESFFMNLIPILFFVAACFLFNSEMQLMLAAVMSCIYTLVMMLVLIGLALQMTNEGVCSPTTIFFIYMVSVFLIAGILHPQEFFNLLHGPLYFLTVPSTNMLMILYAVCNLNIVSWGTRETKRADGTDAKNDNPEGGQNKSKAAGWMDQTWFSFLNRAIGSQTAASQETSDYTFSFGNLFKCMCCPKPTDGTDHVKMDAIIDKLERLERSIHALDSEGTECMSIGEELSTPDGDPFSKNFKASQGAKLTKTEELGAKEFQDETEMNPDGKVGFTSLEAKTNDYLPTMPQVSTNTDGNKLWQQDPDLNTNKIRYISRSEWEFWADLVTKYLHPIDKDDAKQAKIEEDLHLLRNQVCLFFFIVNGLFIVVIFTLQLINSQSHGQGLAIPLPCESRTGVQLTIEPISLLFMIIFGLALTIQFFAMVFHRLGTLHHIIASTDINCLRLNQNETVSMDIQSKIQLVRELQGESQDNDDTKSVVSTATLDSVDDDSWADEVPRVKRRKTVMKIVHNKKLNQDTSNDLGQKFVLNFMKLADDLRQTGSDDEVNGSDEKSGKRSVSRKSRKANPKGSLKLKKKQSLYALAKLKDEKEAVLSKAEFIGEKWKIAREKKQQTRQQTSGSVRRDEAGGQANESPCLTGDSAMLTNQQQANALNIINEEETLKRNKDMENISAEPGANTEKQNGGHEEGRCETTILVTRPSTDHTTSDGEQSKTSTLESVSVHDGGDRRVTGSLIDEGGLSDVSRTDSDIQLINHYFEGIDAPSSESNLSDDEESLHLSKNVTSQ